MLEVQHLKDFSINTWYDMFKNITLKTILFELTPELLNKFRKEEYESGIGDICTPEYINQIKNVIKSFNNEAFVKNNWHAPTDAKFMSCGNTLKVTTVDDIILYFTASDIIMSDFDNLSFNDYCIAIRPWINIHPASEFRCIVINNILRGISPRDWPTYYGHYEEEGPDIINKISEFFKENIQNIFNKSTYAFDVIVSYPDDIKLVDFSPLSNKTNLYAFNWKEVQSIMQKGCTNAVAPVFRYLENDIGIMSKADALFNSY